MGQSYRLERHARNPQLEVALGQSGHTFLRVIRCQRIITMQTVTKKHIVESPTSKPPTGKAPEIASASVPDTLASLKVNPETGLARAEVDVRRKQNGYNEVAETKGHPVLKFLRKFWGISAWMLELIMVLSAVLGKY